MATGVAFNQELQRLQDELILLGDGPLVNGWLITWSERPTGW